MIEFYMVIKTKVSFKEYVRLLYSLTYERTMMRVLVGIAVLIALWITLYYVGYFKLPEPVIYQYITLVLIAFIQPLVIFITIRRNYRSSNHLSETTEMDITPTDLKIKGESFYMEINWDKIFKIVERKHWFMIYQNSLSAIIIPKAGLQEHEADYLKQLFRGLKHAPVALMD